MIGIRIHSRHLGEYIVPTAAEHETELAGRGVDVIPYALIEGLGVVARVFPGAQVEHLVIGPKPKARRR